MSVIRINRHPSRTQLLLFGVVWLVLLSFWGVMAWRSGRSALSFVCWTAAAVAVPGFVVTSWLRTIYLAASYATFPIGFVVSHVILAVIFYGLISPIGWLMRLFGYDPLFRVFDRQATSYWKTRGSAAPAHRYFRQH